MQINDVLGVGKVLPIDKLIDIVSKATGRISKPYFDKKDIDTKAYEIKRLAEAKAEEMKIIANAVKENYTLTGGIEYKEHSITINSPKEIKQDCQFNQISSPPLEERTRNRVDFREAKKQLNLESITSYAAEELRNEETVTDEPLNEDWTTRYFNIAEDISSEEMQALWGRILAGEIKRPKTFSLRTLELLKNLSKDEADIFTKFANARLKSFNKNVILNNDNGIFLKEEFGITFSDTLLMSELGLIATENNLEFSFQPTANNTTNTVIQYGDKGIIFFRGLNCPKQSVQVIAFTKTGAELSTLIQITPNMKYLEKVCSSFKHPNIKIEYGDLIVLPNDQVELSNQVEFI